MSDYDNNLIEDHQYDGIQEYDNPMPSWWINTFYLSILVAIFYVVAQGWGYINTYGKDLKAKTVEVEEIQRAYAEKQPPLKVTKDVLLAAMGNPKALTAGAKTFKASCASCHGMAGEGGIGPNLTDDHWIKSGEPIGVFSTISGGTPNGMPAWQPILRPVKMVEVVAFIHQLQKTSPANGKAAQGKASAPDMGVTAKMIEAAKVKMSEQEPKSKTPEK